MSLPAIESSWETILSEEFQKTYFQEIATFLRQAEEDKKAIYPSKGLIFNAFNTTPFEAVKVVILGQDPYHNPNQAMGLSFSVPKGQRIPPSLRNIYKELADDVNFIPPAHGDLTPWAKQGVFLLNAMLTVEKKAPGSHKNIGWQNFTDTAIRALSAQGEHLVFMLWGAFAQKKKALINDEKHLILQSPHPSPFSAHKGFLGNRHFSQANAYLLANGKSAIDWSLDLEFNLF